MSASRALGVTSALSRPFARTTLKSTVPFYGRAFAFSSYGGGEGDPKGENPQQQGSNPSESKEHPGPPPPTEGQGTGGATKAKGERNTPDKKAEPSSDSPPASRSNKGAQPKILNSSEPDQQNSEDVARHNREMDNRYDRPTESMSEKDIEKEKVSKGYWSGHGGAERKP